jgi:hypothetical protein
MAARHYEIIPHLSKPFPQPAALHDPSLRSSSSTSPSYFYEKPDSYIGNLTYILIGEQSNILANSTFSAAIWLRSLSIGLPQILQSGRQEIRATENRPPSDFHPCFRAVG